MATPELNFDDWVTIPETPPASSLEDASRYSSPVLVPSQGSEDSNVPKVVALQASDGWQTIQATSQDSDADAGQHAHDGESSESLVLASKTQHRAILPHPTPPTTIFLSADLASKGRAPNFATKRSRLDDEQLRSFRETRKLGSCVQCIALKGKCGFSVPCLKCMKRGVPSEFCCRDKMRDIEIFRARGELPYSAMIIWHS
jgi:hypothetical protein